MTPPENKPKPDWDSFETWKGEEKTNVPRFLETLFHGFMLLLLAALVFTGSGALLVFLLYRRSSATLSALSATHEVLYTFLIGGAIGLISGICIYVRKIKQTVI